MSRKNKKEKNKIEYVDDGRTIADMSALGGSQKKSQPRQRATYREMFETYIAAVKRMFLPMLVVLGIIAAAFLIIYIIL